jgi:hypothetical protein
MVLETLWQTEVQDLIPCVFFLEQRQTEEGRAARWERWQETTAVERSRPG